MNCRDYQQMISRLVDLELKAAASAELFEHLGRCAECREFFDTLTKLNAEFDKAQLLTEPPEEFAPSFVRVESKRVFQYSPAAPALALPQKPRSIGSNIRTLALAILIIVIGCVMFSTTISVGARGESTIQPTLQNGVR